MTIDAAVADTASQGKLITKSSFTRVDLLIVNNVQVIIHMPLLEHKLLLLQLFLRTLIG